MKKILNWTSQTPTEEGAYWWAISPEGEPVIHNIRYNSGQLRATGGVGFLVVALGGFWAGPLVVDNELSAITVIAEKARTREMEQVDEIARLYRELGDCKSALRTSLECVVNEKRRADAAEVECKRLDSGWQEANDLALKNGLERTSALEEVERLRKAAIPICVGKPIIQILAEHGQWVSESGAGVVAADSLFRKDPYKELESLRAAILCESAAQQALIRAKAIREIAGRDK